MLPAFKASFCEGLLCSGRQALQMMVSTSASTTCSGGGGGRGCGREGGQVRRAQAGLAWQQEGRCRCLGGRRTLEGGRNRDKV